MLQNYFSKLRATLLLVFLGVAIGNAWGETVTYTVASTTSVTTSGVTPNGSSATYTQTYATACQMTKGNNVVLTLSGFDGQKITGLTLSMKSNSKGGTGYLNATIGETSFASISAAAFNTDSWYGAWSTTYVNINPSVTPTIVGAGEKIKIKIEATANSLYCESFTLTYEQSDTPLPPSITAEDVEIGYDATSGSIPYTINNPADGSSVTAATDASWLTIGAVGETVPFTCTANESNDDRTATVTLTYTYNTNETVTKDIIVTQAGAPVIYTTIPALLAAATSTSTPVAVTFGGWVVTGVNGNQVFVTDGTNGFIVYQKDHGFVVGNTLSGTAECNLIIFNGSAELTGLTSTTEGLTVGANGSVTPVDATIDALGAVNTGSVVTLNNLKYNGSTLSDGTNTIDYYTSLYEGTTLENDKIYNVTGVFVLNNTTKRILPRSADDIVEVLIPSISAENVNIAYDATEGEIEYTINNPVEGVNLAATTTASWISNIAVAADKVTFTTTANGETTDRTAEITLSYEGAEDKVVTVTQAAYVAPFDPTTWTLASAITSGKHYIIVSENGMAMGMQNTNNRAAVEIDIEDETATVNSADVYEFVIESVDGGYTIYDAVGNGYLYAASSSSNHLKTETELDDNGKWTITFDTEGKASVVAQGGNTRNVMQYNSNNTLFACYGSASQAPVYFYEKVEPQTYTREVTEGNYGTICLPYATSEVSGADFYTVAGYTQAADGTVQSISLEPVTGQLQAGVAYIFQATASELTATYTGEAVSEPVAGALVGTFEATTAPVGENYYVLSGGKIYEVDTEVNIAANRAYIDIAALSEGEAKGVVLTNGNSTAIQSLEADGQQKVVYDMQGRRVEKAVKGLYIVNGKKVVIK